MADPVLADQMPILSLQDLSVSLFTRRGVLPAVDGLSLTVSAGETLAIVGESGCGKSLTALAIMRLLPWPPAKIVSGQVRFMGRDLASLSEREMQRVRGKDISMIFQDPMTSLNPVVTVGDQLVEAIRRHTDVSRAEAHNRAVELLRRVRIPDAERRLNDYPHQMSGGMSQRVMIAMAIACGPKLLIADEPTTALDVTIQAQIIELMKELQSSSDMGLIIITHDLGVVAEIADRVAVMYAGRKVEDAPVEALFERPLHRYTRGLLGATPSAQRRRGGRLVEIAGNVPALSDLPKGCAFQNRCPDVFDRCRAERPQLAPLLPHRSAACFAAEKELSRDAAVIGA
ncbi:peptide/nickel transport system ATP-binding protein [Bradyrhizobium sp. NFR13]|jgi:oligopeptide/dipeptide ABC transporter ATP-binding protein|uniref:ABC transporter ATP-binding protein n=1 Tax=Bradyrhizobium sp. NFR13 TaxID=1566285 RepID=UPI0008E7D150|nr:ABC transporter ATP-binding protein [Bradyrhizobium sp. NFR13]SFL76672.1 peptide/nickel transport system ATP-binding protein [Bradyrhizobium sp. NFR13]